MYEARVSAHRRELDLILENSDELGVDLSSVVEAILEEGIKKTRKGLHLFLTVILSGLIKRISREEWGSIPASGEVLASNGASFLIHFFIAVF